MRSGAIVARMEKATARNDVDSYLTANLDFHDRLVTLAGNAKLLAYLSSTRQ